MIREIKEELGVEAEVTGHFLDTMYRYGTGFFAEKNFMFLHKLMIKLCRTVSD